MRNLLLLAAGGALCALQDGAEGSLPYDDNSLLPSLTDVSYGGPSVGYESRLKSLVAARTHQNRRRDRLTSALFGVLAVALSAAFLILQCFMLLKSKGLTAAPVRRLAERGDPNCIRTETKTDKEKLEEAERMYLEDVGRLLLPKPTLEQLRKMLKTKKHPDPDDPDQQERMQELLIKVQEKLECVEEQEVLVKVQERLERLGELYQKGEGKYQSEVQKLKQKLEQKLQQKKGVLSQHP